MAEISRSAVTGISNSNQEGLIAASLRRIGWEVVFRATSAEGLLAFLKDNPDVQILVSDDFKGVNQLRELQLTLLRGHSQPLLAGGINSPQSDQELSQIMQSSIHQREASPIRFEPFTGKLLALTSISRSAGTSTIALNMAQEIALADESVLLIDANLSHPQIASLCDLNGLTKGIKLTRFGFSVTEIVSVDSLSLMLNELSKFHLVIVDLGQLAISDQTSTGRRIGDLLLSWTLQSAAQLYLLSTSDDLALEELKSNLHLIRAINPILAIDHIITSSVALGRREREKISLAAKATTGLTPHIYPRDKRSLDLAKLERGTLATSAPKSLLRVEISSHFAKYKS